MKTTILVVEDEKRIADWLQRYLVSAGFQTMVANDGLTGLEMARYDNPDLIILDLKLPDIDGTEICKRLRKESDVPIIMLTARDSQRDRIEGLEIGADDYIVKPFDPEEVVARANAVLRRAQGETQSIVQVGVFELNTLEHCIYLHGKQINLSAQQYAILATFIRNPNRLMTRDQIIDAALKDFEGFDRAIDTHIRRIRRLIEKDTRHPRYIRTVYGAGYRFVPE